MRRSPLAGVCPMTWIKDIFEIFALLSLDIQQEKRDFRSSKTTLLCHAEKDNYFENL
jgi:hypothetical protein